MAGGDEDSSGSAVRGRYRMCPVWLSLGAAEGREWVSPAGKDPSEDNSEPNVGCL